MFQSTTSPSRHEGESRKLDEIADLSSRLLDLKKTQSWLIDQKMKNLQSKCQRIKKVRIEEYKQKTSELDAKEKELCRKTNKLVEELANSSEDTPFHHALIKILGNLKGKKMLFLVIENNF